MENIFLTFYFNNAKGETVFKYSKNKNYSFHIYVSDTDDLNLFDILFKNYNIKDFDYVKIIINKKIGYINPKTYQQIIQINLYDLCNIKNILISYIERLAFIKEENIDYQMLFNQNRKCENIWSNMGNDYKKNMFKMLKDFLQKTYTNTDYIIKCENNDDSEFFIYNESFVNKEIYIKVSIRWIINLDIVFSNMYGKTSVNTLCETIYMLTPEQLQYSLCDKKRK